MATHNINITLDGTLITDQTTVTPVSGDFLLLSDTSDTGNLKKVDASNFLGGTDTVAIDYSHSSGNLLADVDDYYISIGTTMGNTINSQGLKTIQGGTLVAAAIDSYNAGTFGSSENNTVTLYTNGGADSYVLSTTVKFDARRNSYLITGLSEVITSGESYIVLDTPNFVTNPTSAKLSVTLYIEL